MYCFPPAFQLQWMVLHHFTHYWLSGQNITTDWISCKRKTFKLSVCLNTIIQNCHYCYHFISSNIGLPWLTLHCLCGHSFLNRNNLILRGSLELPDLVPHPLSEIVLQLEYVIQWGGPIACKLEQKMVSIAPGSKFKINPIVVL